MWLFDIYLVPVWLVWGVLCLGAMPAAYLGLLALAALPRGRKPKADPTGRIRLAVVVPAHNEALMIADTVTGILAQAFPPENFTLLVVADNCRDATAALARGAGARVLERHDNPGKGQALDAAFRLLLAEDWDAVLVVDADTRLHPDTLTHLAAGLAAGADALQVRYGVLNPAESWRTAAMELALASFNALRPLGKNRLGASAGLFGNGFCLSRRALTEVPYLAGSIVEDLEYHLHLLRAGMHVHFLQDVTVCAQMPANAADARSQRVRWERGRFGLIRALAPGLLKDLLRGNRFAVEALIDICMPPVSLVGLCLVFGLTAGTRATAAVAAAGLGALALHYLIAAVRFGHAGRTLRVLVHLPWYVVWKTWAVCSSLVRQRALGWVRTKRH